MWGEGASDLWDRLEQEEDERDAELLEAVRARLRERAGETVYDDDNEARCKASAPPPRNRLALVFASAGAGNSSYPQRERMAVPLAAKGETARARGSKRQSL